MLTRMLNMCVSFKNFQDVLYASLLMGLRAESKLMEPPSGRTHGDSSWKVSGQIVLQWKGFIYPLGE